MERIEGEEVFVDLSRSTCRSGSSEGTQLPLSSVSVPHDFNHQLQEVKMSTSLLSQPP